MFALRIAVIMKGEQMSRPKAFVAYLVYLTVCLLLPGYSHGKENRTHYKNVYSNQILGIEFGFPNDLDVYQQGNDLFLVVRSSQQKKWQFLDRDLVSKLMSGKRAVEPESYVLHIRVQKGIFDEVNKNEKVFAHHNGVVKGDLGRFGLMKAKPISAFGWNGYETQVICTVFDPKTGPHAAGGDCYWAIGSNGETTFVSDTLGDAKYLKLAGQVTRSIRLLP